MLEKTQDRIIDELKKLDALKVSRLAALLSEASAIADSAKARELRLVLDDISDAVEFVIRRRA